MGMFRKDARGSATIEMAVLMPMIAVLMILLIYLALYLYDRTVLYGDAYLAALRASELSEERSEEVYAKADAWFSSLKEGQLIALSEMSRELTVDAKGVRILYNGEVVVPIMTGNMIFDQWESFCFSGDAYAARHRPVTFIRRCRVLEELLGQEEEAENSGETEPEVGQIQ
ncbi:MAG: pilus assembly protein [Lachnospiraceae bacterium]|nr:pilus assembly protein [Lachnospiraceae bacterium]